MTRFAGTGGPNGLAFSLPVTPSGDLVTWTEITRRTRGGPWTDSTYVFTGPPDESGLRAETLVTEPSTPVYDRR